VNDYGMGAAGGGTYYQCADCTWFWFIGNRRDSLEHLAVKRKAKLISPYIWRDATANPKEPWFFSSYGKF
jgi:hypothetical protein